MEVPIVDPKVLVLASSFVTWLIYKRYEPSSILATLLLLVAFPGFVVSSARNQFSNLLAASLTIYSAFYFLLVFFIVAYRISPFHRLANFPGPFWFKVSKFALVREYARGTALEFFTRAHEKYGDVVRIGPNELSFRHGDVVAPILTTKPLQKGPYYDSRKPPGAPQLDGMRDFAVHSKRRKLWNKSMAPMVVREYGESLKGVIGELVEAFEKREGQTLDISEWMGYVSFDFMGHMAYSRSFGLVKSGRDNQGFIDAIDRGVGQAAFLSHVPWSFAFLTKLPAAGAIKELRLFTAKITKERVQGGSQFKDLFHFLIAEDEPEELRPSIEDVAADGMVAVIAGSETSATAMSHLFYFLLRHPECMSKLRKEIDNAFPDADQTMDLSKHAEMSYLNACINEALRLYPPVLAGLQRRVDWGSGGRMIGPYFVPEDTQVSAHVPLIHRDPRYFSPLPNTFWPDRFLTQSTYTLPNSSETIPSSQLVHERNLFLPFSAGPQNCAGRAIAQQEMRAVVCTVLRKFEIRAAEGYDLNSWERDLKDFYVTKKGQLPVTLKKRAN